MNYKISIVTLFSTIIGIGLLQDPPSSHSVEKSVLRFAGEVLAKSEYGPKEHDVALKWNSGPTLAVFEGDDSQKQLTNETVKHINSALPEKYRIKVSDTPNSSGVQIKMHFVPFSKFQQLSKEYGFKMPPPSNNGYFHTWWNGRHEIYKAVVLIATDKLKSPLKMQHAILEEITQSMGPIGDSSIFPHSIFFENNEKKVYGTATHLSAIDKKLIRFLYEHVPAGSHQTEIGYFLAKHWE